MAGTVLERLGITSETGGPTMASLNPADGSELGRVRLASADDYERTVEQSIEVFRRWRMFPAPKRGQIVREIGDELRRFKDDLGALVTLETGKILAEGKGEVQEMIDIADFAVGLSRQLYGLTIASERPEHRMYEQWQPLGVVGVISAFNFPVAVWSWNALLAAVCGDCVLWKPSLKTPLTAIAVQNICDRVLDRHGWRGVFQLIIGDDATIGKRLIEDRRVPLISATGSTRMGRIVAETVGQPPGPHTAGTGRQQRRHRDERCESRPCVARRALWRGGHCRTALHQRAPPLSCNAESPLSFTAMLQAAYAQQVRVGDPLDENTLMGPLIDRDAVVTMTRALSLIEQQGGELIQGGDDLGGCFVAPALVKAHPGMPILQEEVFAPILYLIEFDTLDEVIAWHNNVPQGLSSAMFTTNLISAENFLSARGSDCGIANINIGTSGAEIGGAFGGEKDTGGGRESGSDSWKSYMRRQTVTINWSNELPLAQGIEFEI
jgi:aldehyde dehydrogenase (NAD+)